MIPQVSLGPDGPKVSQLAYGVWRLAEDPAGTDLTRIGAKIDACLEVGMTTFDHADIYGGYVCEGLFGRVLRAVPALRDQIQIVTKCDIRAPSPNRSGARVKHYDATAAAIAECVDRSLRELATDRIDVLLIHRPDWLTPAEETARGLEAVVKAGKVRSVGVSNYSASQFDLLQEKMRQPLVTNQIELNVLATQALTDGTLDQCQKRNLRPMAWSPTAGGKLFDAKNPAAQRVQAVVTAFGDKYGGAGVDQILFAWILALPTAPVVIVGSNSPERIRAAARAAEIKLDRQDWYALWEAGAGREVP